MEYELSKRGIAALQKIAWAGGEPVLIGSIDTRMEISDFVVEWTKENQSLQEYCTLSKKGRKLVSALKRRNWRPTPPTGK